MPQPASTETTPLIAAEGLLSPAHSHSPELDVLRSTLALMVVIHHSSFIFENPTFPSILQPIWTILRNGKLSVMAFYVLSGVVIARRYIATGSHEDLMLAVIKRLPRLAVPVLAASIVACLLANVGAFANVHRVQSHYGGGWCGGNSDGTCWSSDWHAALKTWLPPFAGPFPAGVLWTLQGELVGSMFIFALAPAFTWISSKSGKVDAMQRTALLHIVVLSVLVYLSFLERRIPEVFEGALKMISFAPTASWGQLWRALFLFEAGFAFEQMQTMRPPVSLRTAWLSLLLVLLGLSTVLATPPSATLLNYEDCVTVGGVLLVYGVLLIPVEIHDCCNLFKTFGRIGFGMYLLHGSVLYSFGASTYLMLRDWNFGPGVAYWSCLVLCLPVLLSVSYLFWICVEKPFAIDGPRLVGNVCIMSVARFFQSDRERDTIDV